MGEATGTTGTGKACETGATDGRAKASGHAHGTAGTDKVLVRIVEARGILSKSNLPVCEYSANPYVGCTHGCAYCYASIERRLAAMEAFHRAGVRTTCFISPIFPGITDVEAIVRRVQGRCNLVWLENLNLHGGFCGTVMAYIAKRRPDLVPLYRDICERGDRSYWEELDARVAAFCAEAGLDYVTNDDSAHRPFDAPPVVVNYFHHEQIKKSARRRQERARASGPSR